MSALHPHASLLEARPHIFRSGRGRPRGLVKHIKGKWKEWALAWHCLLSSGPYLVTHLLVRGPTGSPACVPASFTFHSLLHSTDTSACLLWARPCAGH